MAAVNALNSLLKGTSIDDHEEALKLANAAITAAKSGTSPEKLTAQHTKVVALLKLDRFGDALRVIADAGDALAARCVLEHAYALYKTGELDAAEALLASDAGESGNSTQRALQHVAAQSAYRGEKFGKAAALYASLAAEAGSAGEDADVRVNTLATGAQQGWQGDDGTTGIDAGRRQDLEGFETAYNAGCGALAAGDVARASVLLRRAQQLCEASDDLSDDDKRAELLPILVQQSYALTRLGRLDEAATLQKAVDLADTEGSTKVVTQTNGILIDSKAATNSSNPYVLHHQLEAVPAPPVGSDRLFAHQARILRRNQFAIELQCFKFKGVQSRTAQQLKSTLQGAKQESVLPENVDLGVFHAAAKVEMQTGKDALRRIQPLLANRPDDIGVLLTAIQLHLQEKNPEAAVSLLESFFKRSEGEGEAASAGAKDARFAPGLVALAVSLYKLQGRHAAVRAELAQAVAHWQKSTTSPPTSLLRAAGVELLRSPIPADQATAAAAFEQLHAADPADRIAVAGLVASTPAASAGAQREKQEKLAQSLTPVDQLIKSVDVAKLLQGGVAVLPAPAAKATSKKRKGASDADGAAAAAAATDAPAAKKPKTATGAATATTLSRQARKLQAKDASAFDANKKMDAERWLPLRDRSSYRPPKGKKGGRNNRRGGAETQGGIVKEEETLALAGGAGSVKVEKAAPSGGGAAKKRKKGKK